MAPPKNIGSSRSTDVRQFRSPTDRSAVTRMLPPHFACRRSNSSSASAWLTLAAVFLFCSTAQADEGGVPPWLSGSFFFSAAVPNQPRWYIPTQICYYNGSAFFDKTFRRGGTLNLGLSAQAELAFITPTGVPNTKLCGGQPTFSLTGGGGWERTSVIDLAWERVPCELRLTERENHEAIGDVIRAHPRSGGCCRCVVRPVGDGRVFTSPGVVG